MNEFVANVNKLKVRFAKSSIVIKYKLRKCIYVIIGYFMGFLKKCVNRFYITWRKSRQHLLNFPYNTHSTFLPHIIEENQWSCRYSCVLPGFLSRYNKGKNGLLRLCYKLASSGSCSGVSNNYVFMQNKY